MKKLLTVIAVITALGASAQSFNYVIKGEPVREGSVKLNEDGTFTQTVSVIVGIEGEPFGLQKVVTLDVPLSGDYTLNEVYKVVADKGKLYEAAIAYMKQHFEESK